MSFIGITCLVFLKVNLGVVRAMENVEKTFLLNSNIKMKKLSKAAEMKLYRDFLEHGYQVISEVFCFGCS